VPLQNGNLSDLHVDWRKIYSGVGAGLSRPASESSIDDSRLGVVIGGAMTAPLRVDNFFPIFYDDFSWQHKSFADFGESDLSVPLGNRYFLFLHGNSFVDSREKIYYIKYELHCSY